ncbi:trefoil factor 1 precursor [Rattus norvegicus]|uniref:Trefoil factor 1 n=1 Tax=Rattus norvegicus TaxID=10116 RepID=TFF1_RAT|nr:trefoil factor 1 precursor [Rattus norvegicus]Q63467.1 RecName: Full=Trefoil factor 1; AltName: Full=Protein pS2; Flags: Precursor [Rattus norvegicus]BAA11857.1 pS2 peptide [Rattus norvegicus]|eukprot:NP_476470.1 trefoil factor 1 precursor [Rattus norvegicus]
MEHKVTCVLAMVLMLALSSLAQNQEETCAVIPRERINCGFPGVTAQQCKEKGCCFDDSVRGFPWCFRPLVIENQQEEECPF